LASVPAFSAASTRLLTIAVMLCVFSLILGWTRFALTLLPLALALAICYERWLRCRGACVAAHALSTTRAADNIPAEGSSATDGVDVDGHSEDADVATERVRVASLLEGMQAGTATSPPPALLLHSLRKVYPARGGAPTKVAVADLSLSIGKGEVLGLLGANGAGKTSTMAMLTGDTLPTAGLARICGYDLVSELGQVRQVLGYCPQVDPILELMTGREYLLLFARLRGISVDDAIPIVSRLLEQVSLTPHADRLSGSLSGGSKRKLSLAVALVGSPAVVFLDEPSSGMDPVARRRMWDLITRERSKHSIVLTSHSMEECEALCTRIGIMRCGRMRCLGSQQHLKSRFGTEYKLEVRCAEQTAEGGDDTETAVRSLLPGAELSDRHGATLKFRVPSERFVLADIFEAMEKHKQALRVWDYACSQPRLEEIFHAISEPGPRNRACHDGHWTASSYCGPTPSNRLKVAAEAQAQPVCDCEGHSTEAPTLRII